MFPCLPRHFGTFVAVLALAAALRAQTPFVSSPWCGNVTATSATAALRVVNPGMKVRLLVSRTADLSESQFSLPVASSAETGNAVKLEVQGLLPNTEYFYGFEINGSVSGEVISRGRFRTFPLGAASFKIAFSSCADYRKEDQSAFSAIEAERPLLFINTGDLHYNDTNSTNVEDYRRNYDGVLQHPVQASLYRNIPVAYMWDDHDFSGNDSDGGSIGRDAARRAYRERVPHYPLGSAGGTMAQAFTIGRVRVIMTDMRSAADSRLIPDNAAKSHLGEAQKTWFKQELIAARDADFPLIIWVCTAPWIGTAGSGDDDWSVYSTERREIANFIKANRIKNVTLISGDMHALAYDNGAHSDYADGGGAPLVVLHAAALTSDGSSKGGPYTGGPFPGNRQYGVLEVTDTGGTTIAANFSGKRVGEGTKLTYDFTAQTSGKTTSVASAPLSGDSTGDKALTAISTRGRIVGGDVLIAGFVVSGRSPRNVMIRAVGPSLVPHGVPDALPNPKLVVYQGPTAIADNDDWGTGNVTQISAGFVRGGLFPYSSQTSKDSALFLLLAPGVYTAQVRSADGAGGVTLVEVYDVP
ncbi:MAG TPA: alkaline phosphatase D family protein [Opitutaceae bacterium]|nr:alkaline phosphatase D family protein [Opitutaceae bacterium]